MEVEVTVFRGPEDEVGQTVRVRGEVNEAEVSVEDGTIYIPVEGEDFFAVVRLGRDDINSLLASYAGEEVAKILLGSLAEDLQELLTDVCPSIKEKLVTIFNQQGSVEG